MKFCSNCGHAVVLRVPDGDNRPRSVCDNCGTIHYVNPRNVVGHHRSEDKVLLCKRAIERATASGPCGGLHGDRRDHRPAASRETLEEAGARVQVGELFSILNVPHVHQVHLFYLATLDDLDVAPGEESLEVKLVAEADVPWDELAFPTVIHTLRCFFADRAAGRCRMQLPAAQPGHRQAHAPADQPGHGHALSGGPAAHRPPAQPHDFLAGPARSVSPVEHALGPIPRLPAACRSASCRRSGCCWLSPGIFPWYSSGQPVLWWSTDPRMVLPPPALRVSANLRKTLRRVLRDADWEIRVDHDFLAVMRACATRRARPGRHLDHRRHHRRIRHPAPQRPGPLGRKLVPRRARRRPVWRGAGADVLWRIDVCAPHRRVQDRAGGAVRVPRQPRRGDDRLPAGNRPPGLAGARPSPAPTSWPMCARQRHSRDQSVAVRQIGAGALAGTPAAPAA
ncbi:ADP-ribose pyrophosphatase (modular protein) [Cupriavidus taiwanensis]|nr:ADP-ribose pyrophosphatase (modular protein) [Cupriavidus taiwanensis]